MDDVGFLNKNSAVFKSVTVEVAGMKNAKFTQAFFKNIKDNGRDITARAMPLNPLGGQFF
jgi:hypothetical protein